jgi:hypothetical protein
VHTGELEEEGTTPYVLDLPFQGQERRCEDWKSLSCLTAKGAVIGSERTMPLGWSANDDKGQSTHKQLSFTLGPTVRRISDVDMLVQVCL